MTLFPIYKHHEHFSRIGMDSTSTLAFSIILKLLHFGVVFFLFLDIFEHYFDCKKLPIILFLSIIIKSTSTY